ncbi:hypothetical protein BH11PSE11_BH11PSE11_04100 [soil metagenome]
MKCKFPNVDFRIHRSINIVLLSSGIALLASCAAPDAGKANAPTATTTVASSPATAPAPAAPPVAVPYEQAVMTATKDLFSKANLPADRKYSVVIDPLVDGVTGIQTMATDATEKHVVQIVKTSFPQFDIKNFNAATVAELPLVMIGTFTPINLQGKADGEKDAFRICFALLDLKTGKIISKALTRAQTLGVDSLPKPFFRDSPIWVSDAVVEGYIKTCQGPKAGDPINPAYLDKISAATGIDEAMQAYNRKNYREALALFNAVARAPGGDQPRVNIGIYLANLGLGQRPAAMKAFGNVVDYGLKNKRLAVKFGFRPGSASFDQSGPLNDQWLKELANHTANQSSCTEVAGHSSRGGSEPLNERLSLQRAEYVKQRLASQRKDLAARLKTQGYGSRQSLIGTGKSDLSDALDQRIEFKPTDC